MVPYKNHMIRARTGFVDYLDVCYGSDRFYGGFTGFTDRERESLRTIYGSLDRDFFTDTEYSCFFCMFLLRAYTLTYPLP